MLLSINSQINSTANFCGNQRRSNTLGHNRQVAEESSKIKKKVMPVIIKNVIVPIIKLRENGNFALQCQATGTELLNMAIILNSKILGYAGLVLYNVPDIKEHELPDAPPPKKSQSKKVKLLTGFLNKFKRHKIK